VDGVRILDCWVKSSAVPEDRRLVYHGMFKAFLDKQGEDASAGNIIVSWRAVWTRNN
jgi:hypothetical protein